MLRKFKRKFGIYAPRVAVQTTLPWQLRWGLLFLSAVAVVVVAWATYDYGRRLAGFDSGAAARENARLAELVARMQEENTSLRRQVAMVERQVEIERATQGNLTGQVKTLSEENALLKEDLAFFQTLMTSGNEPGGITISRFKVFRDALPGEYRYRLLVVQSRQRGKEFQGKLQLVVDVEADGRNQVMLLPAADDSGSAYLLNFKFYQRVEGTFKVPEGAAVKKVQVRVLENGVQAPRSSQSVTVL